MLLLLFGSLLGCLFFGGLWWTVKRSMASRWVALWFFGSLLVRTSIVLAGFYWACGSEWQKWLTVLMGFTVARLLVARLTQLKHEAGASAVVSTQGGEHRAS